MNEPREPQDQAHRSARQLNLTVAGCPCRGCSHLRDIALVSRSKFGEEDDEALAAMDRMQQRVSS